jgi:3-hydroxyisobutyrate dehydrogenase
MIAQALAGTSTGEVTVDVATMRKDVRAMLAQGQASHYQLPLTSLLLQTLEKAGRAGLDGVDCTQVPVWWLKEAGKA